MAITEVTRPTQLEAISPPRRGKLAISLTNPRMAPPCLRDEIGGRP